MRRAVMITFGSQLKGNRTLLPCCNMKEPWATISNSGVHSMPD